MKTLILFFLAAFSFTFGSAQTVKDTALETASNSFLVLFKDAETGEYRAPTPEERAELEKKLGSQSGKTDQPIEEILNADGSVTVRLNGRFESFSIIRKNPDGSTQLECVKSEEEAIAFLNHKAKGVRDEK